ncbi:protein kinase [Streptomyces sp. RFCAC02]|uniref:protein kinase domain-containing protein n=1 Tax=Streptomyces sp. RFCAC02 TaxID=2499143 RepID=UPI00101E891B|nr:protein kinase [Streptomyces sp. RFCAC02]
MTGHSTVGGGRYALRRLLGRGGMAAVHLAWDTVLEREVAVKTMRSEVSGDDAFRERFRREAQAVAKLTHPNIVSVYDTGEEREGGGAVPYMVMEYVDGQGLRDVLENDIAAWGAMPADKALRITAGVLAALDLSHEKGLVHRDIKPGNVMITRRGAVKVMDFGIARAMQTGVTSMTQTGMVVGTPQYLSPEQALGRAVDARADLYSVGVMLFELVTGRVPFDADTGLAVAYAHVTEDPPVASSLNTAIEPALDALIARALRKNPNERFRSAGEMLAECRRVAELLTGAAPSIAPDAPPPGGSGAGIAQAVFPEFGAPVTPSPYALGGGGAYGYPRVGGDTPPAGPYAPPVTPAPVPAAGGGRPARSRATWLVVAAAAVAVALIAAVSFVALTRGGGGEPEAGGTETAVEGTAEATATDGRRYTPGDPEKTIAATECSGAFDHWDQNEHAGAVAMPDFYDVHIDSVKACIRAAGWRYEDDVRYEDETLKGEGMVIAQTPGPGQPYDPDTDPPIKLTVSTGLEPVS